MWCVLQGNGHVSPVMLALAIHVACCLQAPDPGQLGSHHVSCRVCGPTPGVAAACALPGACSLPGHSSQAGGLQHET
jgi:hypothetical protein